jgi:hypothetical protein
MAPNFAASPFAGLTSGDPSAQRLPYLKDGIYLVAISALRSKPSRQGKQFYIIETEIRQSSNPERPPGMRCASFIDLSNVDTRGTHMAQFISAIYGYDFRQVPAASRLAPWVDPQSGQQMDWSYYGEMSVHDSQPWRGIEVGVHVETINTKANTPYSLHQWMPAAQTVVGAPAAASPTPGGAPAQQWAPPPGGQGWGGGPQGR